MPTTEEVEKELAALTQVAKAMQKIENDQGACGRVIQWAVNRFYDGEIVQVTAPHPDKSKAT